MNQHHSKTTVTEQLATIDTRPEADVVVYDGQCSFCTDQVRRLAAWDRGHRLAFLSLHDPRASELVPDLSHTELMQQMVVVDRRGRRHAGAAALRYLTRRLPSLWFLAPLLHLPGSLPIWNWLYRRVAARRYRLGDGNSCHDGSCSTR
jgi:predicted DCC family thiol-disulfide oxidoreductase YuxK